MKRLNVAEMFEPVEVSLPAPKAGDDGYEGPEEFTYRLREGTKRVGEKLEAAQERIDKLSDEEAESLTGISVFCELLDILLEPQPQNGDGTPPSAKKVLTDLWKANKIGGDRIFAIVDWVQHEAQQRANPTSAATSEG